MRKDIWQGQFLQQFKRLAYLQNCIINQSLVVWERKSNSEYGILKAVIQNYRNRATNGRGF